MGWRLDGLKAMITIIQAHPEMKSVFFHGALIKNFKKKQKS